MIIRAIHKAKRKIEYTFYISRDTKMKRKKKKIKKTLRSYNTACNPNVHRNATLKLKQIIHFKYAIIVKIEAATFFIFNLL